MRRNLLFIGFIILIMGYLPVDTQAQDAAMPQNFIVFEEFVSPADMAEFNEVQQEAIDIWHKIGFDIPIFCYGNEEYAFYWVVPIENFAGIDALFEKMMGMSQQLKDEGFDSDEKFRDLSTMRQTVIHWSQELSYHPSGVFGQTKDKPFVEWAFCYLKSGHEKEAGQAIKKYIDFYDSIDETYEWDVYAVMIGHDTPCWILMTRAESELAMRNLENDLNSKYGDKFKEMWGEFSKHVRKFETKKGWFMPDWSLNIPE